MSAPLPPSMSMKFGDKFIVFQKLSNVCPWARSGRRNLILTRVVALGDPRGRKQPVSALSVFLIVFSVWSGLGALRAPKFDSDAGGGVG